MKNILKKLKSKSNHRLIVECMVYVRVGGGVIDSSARYKYVHLHEPYELKYKRVQGACMQPGQKLMFIFSAGTILYRVECGVCSELHKAKSSKSIAPPESRLVSCRIA